MIPLTPERLAEIRAAIEAVQAETCALPWAVCKVAPNDFWHEGRTLYSVDAGTRIGDLSPIRNDSGNVAVAHLFDLAFANLPALLDSLASTRERAEWAEERNVDLNMLAYQWMARHDWLLSFIQNHPPALKAMIEADNCPGFPSPLDVPAAESRAEAAEARAERAEALLGIAAACAEGRTEADELEECWDHSRAKWMAMVQTCMTRATAAEARVAELEGVLRRVEPHIDAIVCYASTMDEHEPNRIALDVRAALTTDKSDG